MLKTAFFDSLPKDVVGVNSRKIVLDGPDFDILSVLDFTMVINFATFSSFMSWYNIKYAPVIFIYFFIGILIHENLGLDTKITFYCN